MKLIPNLLSSKNFFEISGPNPIETPLLLGERPLVGTGSAHSKSHIFPDYGGYLNLMIYLSYLSVTLSWEGKPPWQIITLSFNTYPKGR